MAIPDTNGIFIHNGLNCTPPYVPTAQSISLSPSDSTSTKNAIDTTLSNIAEEFSTSSTYAVNDCVLYQRVLYQCISAVTTAGVWDSSKWAAIKSVDAGLVKQVEYSGSGYDNYELLFAGSTGNTTEINTVNKSSKLVYVPTSGYLELNGRFQANSLRADGFSTYMSQGVGCIYLRGDGTKDSIVIQATSDGGKICLSDDMGYSDTIVLTGDNGNINAISLNGVTIGSSPKFTDTTYESKTASSGGTDLSLVTTGEKYVWNNSQKPIAYINVIGDKTADAWDTSPGSTYSITSITDAFGNNISYSTLWDNTHNMLYDVYFIYKYTPSSGQQNEYTYKWEATRYLYYINMNTIRIEWEWQDASNRYVMMTTDGSTITCAKYQTPVQVYSQANRNFTSSTTLAYTGLSTTCPAGKRMLVRAYFRYVNNAPLQVGAYTSSAEASAYSCMGYGDVNTGTFTLNFVITGGETIYYWAKYSGAGANRIDEEKILLG